MRKPTLTVVFAALASPALAHEGHHETMPSGLALRHLLDSPDHLLMLGAAAALILGGGVAWARRRNAR